jgi:outer membrane protein TolC
MKTFSILLLLITLPAATPLDADASDTGTAPPLEVTPGLLDRLIDEARGRSPALKASAALAEAADAAASAVRSWDDPTASFGVWASGSGGFRTAEQGNLVYGLEQKLPLHNRPELMRKAAGADAERERLTADSETIQLRRDLQAGLLELALADREAELAQEDLTWLSAIAAAADRRYRVGQASQVEWLKAQTGQAMAADDLVTKEQMRDHGAFALNRLLNRDSHSSWPRVALPALQPPIYYTPALVEAAMASEPRLQVLRQAGASAQAVAELTRSSRLPDVSVGLQAWQYSGDGSLKQAMATVSFSVPWLNRGRYDSDWRRDEARKRASDLAAEAYALSVREELHHHVVDLDAARRLAVLYREQLIPLTEQALASAQAAWEHGLGTLQDALDAHRLLVADQLALAQALTQQAGLLADLCLLTGRREPPAVELLAGEPPADHDGHSSLP